MVFLINFNGWIQFTSYFHLVFLYTLLIASQKLFLSKNIVDKINDRSSHSSISTRSGGISIFLTLFIISCYFYISGIYNF